MCTPISHLKNRCESVFEISHADGRDGKVDVYCKGLCIAYRAFSNIDEDPDIHRTASFVFIFIFCQSDGQMTQLGRMLVLQSQRP